MRAACGSTAFDAVAVYEPGISVSGSIPAGWTGRARQEVATGADFEAFITFARGVNPDQTGRVPRWLLRVILRHAIPRAELRQNLALMPQAISEHDEVGRLDGRLADYREVDAPTLIMRGRGSGTSRPAIALARLAADAVLRFFAAHTQPDTEDPEQPARRQQSPSQP